MNILVISVFRINSGSQSICDWADDIINLLICIFIRGGSRHVSFRVDEAKKKKKKTLIFQKMVIRLIRVLTPYW